MAEEAPRRIDIGFQGGQVLSVRVAEEAYSGLKQAVTEEGSERWHDLATQDSEVALDLAQIVYVRVETEEHRVGF